MKSLMILLIAAGLTGCNDWSMRDPNIPTQTSNIKYHFENTNLGMFCTTNEQCNPNLFCLKDSSYVGTCAQFIQ